MVSKGFRGLTCFSGLRSPLALTFRGVSSEKKWFEKMYMVSKGSRGRACFGGLRSNLGSDFQRGRIRKKVV